MSRYENTPIIRKNLLPRNKKSVMVYETTIYPEVPERNDDLHVIAQEGDRLDNLAFEFYGDPKLWWFIAQTNNISTMNVKSGTSLRIPASPTNDLK